MRTNKDLLEEYAYDADRAPDSAQTLEVEILSRMVEFPPDALVCVMTNTPACQKLFFRHYSDLHRFLTNQAAPSLDTWEKKEK